MTIMRSTSAIAQKKAGSDAARVLADQASAFSGRLLDHAYAIPNGTPTAMAPVMAAARRIALLTIASKAVTSRKIGRVFIRSELRRSSDVSRRAGSARNATSKEATARGRIASRKTRASRPITRMLGGISLPVQGCSRGGSLPTQAPPPPRAPAVLLRPYRPTSSIQVLQVARKRTQARSKPVE